MDFTFSWFILPIDAAVQIAVNVNLLTDRKHAHCKLSSKTCLKQAELAGEAGSN